MFLILFLPIFIFAMNYNSLFDLNLTTKSYNNLTFSDFDIKQCKTDIDLNISNKVDLAKYEYYNNDLGIFLDVGGNINDNSGKKSLNAGLTWKLLKGGYRQNQYKADIVLLQNKLKKLNNKTINNSFTYYNDYNFIIYFYNLKKIALLDKYLQFLDLKFNIFRKNYYLKLTTLDKVLAVKQEIANIKHLQNSYKIFNKKVICKNDLKGDIFDFDLKYNQILKDIKDNNITTKIALNSKIIDKEYDIYNSWKFNIYVNREFLDDRGENFGFSLSIPLTKNPKEFKKIEKLKVVSDQKENNIRKYLYLQKNYYTFRYKLSDLINMRYKLSYVKLQLKRAKLRYKFKIGGNNIDRIISNIDSIFAIRLQILDIKQQLLLQSYSLLYNLGLNFDNKYLKQINIDTSLHLRKGNRSLYIWANGFKQYENRLLIELLKLKNIKEVIISISKYQNFKKLEQFIKLAKKNNIKIVYLLQYKHKMKKLDYDIKEVNIYIEKIDKDFAKFIYNLHNKYPNYKIDLTINKHIILPPYINKVYSTDKNSDVKFIEANEYKNELELELAIDNFVKKNKNIAIYNLKTYIGILQ